MAKIASTVNLEECIWKEVDEYMQKNNLTRNTAIEFMFIERKALLKMLDHHKKETKGKQTTSNDDFAKDMLHF